jgi:6-phosphogluconolactonase
VGSIAAPINATESAHACDSGACGDLLVYVGTHGSGGPPGRDAGAAEPRQGIYAARLDQKSGHLTALGLVSEIGRATWLINHPTLPILYSVGLEGKDIGAEASLYSLAVDTKSGQLRELNRVGAGGTDATHLDLDARSMTLFSANHGSGSVTALPVLADGRLGAVVSVQKDFGTGPHRRQSMPQAHGVAVDPSHHYVLSADFGADRIFIYRFDPATRALTPGATPFVSLPAGSGPRHLNFQRNGHFLYLDCELTGALVAYRWDSKRGELEVVQTLSPFEPGFKGEKSAAEIVMSRNGKFLYLSVRGDDSSIVTYAINGRKGTLSELQRVPSGGKTPWSFGIDPSGRWLLVTNEASNAVNEFAVNPTTGKLSATSESLEVPQPVTVAFYPN